MEPAVMMRWAIVGVGLFVVLASFRSHASKHMNSDLATVWCLIGIVIMVIGAVPPLSRWLDKISAWTGAALFCVGAVCLWAAFRICRMISRLVTQNEELAMLVTLLRGVRQQPADDGTETEESVHHEESLVCHEYHGHRRRGEGPAGAAQMPGPEGVLR